MLGWMDFFIIFFWLCLGLFFFNVNNFLTILLFAELTWLVLFVLSSTVGAIINDITSTSITFFILGFGGLEFVVGLMLVVLMRNLNVSLYNNDDMLKNENLTQQATYNNKKWNI